MIIQSRKDVRKAFAALLRTHMTGSGNPAQSVHDHLVSDFDGESPVVIVGSGPILRDSFVFDGSQAKTRLDVHFFVWYGDKDTAPADYTVEAAEDILDEMERIMAGVIEQSKETQWWNAITQIGFSERNDLDIGGNYYLRERFVLEVE